MGRRPFGRREKGQKRPKCISLRLDTCEFRPPRRTGTFVLFIRAPPAAMYDVSPCPEIIRPITGRSFTFSCFVNFPGIDGNISGGNDIRRLAVFIVALPLVDIVI